MRKIAYILFTLLVLGLVIIGCSRTAPPATVPAGNDLGSDIEAKSAASVTVKDQELHDDSIVIAQVTVPDTAWLVIHSDVNGKPGPVIGHSSIDAGESRNVVVPVDVTALTSTLYVMAHSDLGVPNRYEFPGADIPLKEDGSAVMSSFKLLGLPSSGKRSDSDFSTATGPLQEFKLVAKQWEFTPNSIVVNKGDRVRITLTSEDTSHGFAIAEYNINEQIVPGSETVVQFVASKRGTFMFFCSVPCGKSHYNMKGQLIVK